MPTFTQIGTAVTVGSGGAADITFSAIPNTYTDLVVKVSSRSAAAGINDTISLQFNGDTGANYSRRQLYGTGSAAGSDSQSGMDRAQSAPTNGNGSTANTFSSTEFYISNYSGNTQKSISSESVQETNAATAYMGLMANLWTGTAAVSSIKIFAQGGNLLQYTTAYLYGVSNA
jgi:hypothetical protein